jgi:hypothetical protein
LSLFKNSFKFRVRFLHFYEKRFLFLSLSFIFNFKKADFRCD